MSETDKGNVEQRQRHLDNTNHGQLNNAATVPQVRQSYNTITNGSPGAIASHAYNPSYVTDNRPIVVIQPQKKSIVEAYLLWLLLGFLGGHHFYLKRTEWGILYFLTGGLVGCGWLIDMFRLPYLVSQVNKRDAGDENVKRKNISDAYTVWFPFGLLGFHHFYLENVLMGALYFVSGGLCGIGWLIDLARIPSLVKEANLREPIQNREKKVGAAYALGISPFGVLGFHHFYLNRPLWGLFYLLTAGVCGIGWIVDWFRIPLLVKRANKEIQLGTDQERYLDDAYICWFPMGLLGLHHFYLNRPIWGLIYFFTYGLFGVGWLVDGFRLPCLLKDCNRRTRERIEGIPVYQQMPYSGIVVTRTDMSTYPPAPGPPSYTNPIYPGVPGAGYQYPPQTGYQQMPEAGQIPAYNEQPPPYSSAGGGANQTTSGCQTTVTN